MGSRRRSASRNRVRVERSVDHLRSLTNPNSPDRVLSDDEVAHLHREAQRFLQEHGVRVLLEEARDYLCAAGASVGHDGDDQLVRIPIEVTDHALSTTRADFRVHARNPTRTMQLGGSATNFLPVGGPPFVSDLDEGRRAGTIADLDNFLRLTQSFDVIHGNAPAIEPQDVPMTSRHLVTTLHQMQLTDKVPYVFSRGRERVADVMEMMRIERGLTVEELLVGAVCWTNINTNTPRQLDVPMSLGIIDFAKFSQPCIMTPFTLAGAMAPVSLAGALLLQHLEVIAAVTLSQVVRPGAPVIYGGFTSNVDMRSGSPAFGTPEAIKGAVASGQLARHIGLPWRSSGSSSSLTEDAQGAYETLFNMTGAIRGGANVILHSAGWQEGGLCASFEKFILDVEMLQTIAESWQPVDMAADELGFDAIAGVEPGSHFFGTEHTLERFETAFYDPIVSTRSNFEQWTEEGSLDARTRANAVWKKTVADYERPPLDDAIEQELIEFVDRRIAEGGAPVQ